MKRFISYSLISAGMVSMMSCLGDPSTNFTINNAAGVISQEDIYPEKVIYVKGGDIISSSDFQTAQVDAGECILFDYSIDLGSNENINSGKENGYLTATIYTNTITEVSQYLVQNQLVDTASVLSEEQALSILQTRFAYIKDKLFLFTEIAQHSEASVDSFSLSYNPSQTLNAEKVYNIYLRAISLDTLTTGTKTMIVPCAFDIKEFVKNAATTAADPAEIKFKINYVTGFNKDTTSCIWKQSEVFTIDNN